MSIYIKFTDNDFVLRQGNVCLQTINDIIDSHMMQPDVPEDTHHQVPRRLIASLMCAPLQYSYSPNGVIFHTAARPDKVIAYQYKDATAQSKELGSCIQTNSCALLSSSGRQPRYPYNECWFYEPIRVEILGIYNNPGLAIHLDLAHFSDLEQIKRFARRRK